ncbi:hypothetical protein RHMOL_Rhmol04G0149000 [Rhododendron molle]|uniref:Uncharacterized protein n=1 Tax=Rhododendron molle TaxID=49168 RepID=A0ACC0P0G9_RHOML|nr:hypothetical protein RHMOL_Rhmol04G0149000 [Rhododendron molle]
MHPSSSSSSLSLSLSLDLEPSYGRETLRHDVLSYNGASSTEREQYVAFSGYDNSNRVSHSTTTTNRKPSHVWRHSRQPASSRVQATMHDEMLENGVQEAVHVLLPKMLLQVPVRTPRNLRQQAVLPLLQ